MWPGVSSGCEQLTLALGLLVDAVSKDPPPRDAVRLVVREGRLLGRLAAERLQTGLGLKHSGYIG